MLFETEQFRTQLPQPEAWSDSAFRYCEFSEINTEGAQVGSVFANCTIGRCEWYWGLFSGAIFVDVKFDNCTFRGTGFASTRFVDCEFVNC